NGWELPGFLPSALEWDGTSSVQIPRILFGIGAVQLARNPDGVLAIVAEQNHARRVKRRARRAARAVVGDPAVADVAAGAPAAAAVPTPGPVDTGAAVPGLRLRAVVAG